MRLRACHYATGQLIELIVRQGRIAALLPPSPLGGEGLGVRGRPQPLSLEGRGGQDEPIDLVAGWVAPALFDLQINGCAGIAFNSPGLTIDGIRHVVSVCRGHGIGSLCPTLVTASMEALLHGFTTLRSACETDPDLDHALPVFHLEGPYISAEDGPRGAHPRCQVRPPDWAEFAPLAGSRGRTDSPGHPGSRERGRAAVHRTPDRRGRGGRHRPHGSLGATDPRCHPCRRRACQPTWATVPMHCCPGMRTMSGSSSPRMNYGPASSAMAITCRRP